MATTPLTRSGYCAPSKDTTSPPIEWPTTTACPIPNRSMSATTSLAMLAMEIGWPVYGDREAP